MHKRSIYLLFFIFFLTRLTNLGLMPPFNDESIYLEWGLFSIDHLKPFLSLADGKTPFSIWIFGILGLISPFPLTAARLGSVLAGALSLLGIIKISKNYKLGTFPALFYIFAPAFLFFDRQALAEGMLITCFVWSILLTEKIIKNKKIYHAMALAAVWVIGFYIKTSAIIFITTNIIVILFNKKQIELKNTLTVLLCCFTIIMLPLAIQQNFSQIFIQNSRFSLTFSELLKFPLSIWQNNLISIFDIAITQIAGLGLLALIRPSKKYTNLYLWLAIPLFFYITFTRNASVRYLAPLATGLIFMVVTKPKIKILNIIALIMFIGIDILLLFSPKNYFYYLSKISSFSQIGEYTTGFSSGFETKEALLYLNRSLDINNQSLILTRADFGNPESAIAYNFYNNSNTSVYKTIKKLNTQEIQDLSYHYNHIYFVSRNDNLNNNNEYFSLEKKFINEKDGYFVGIYKLDFDILNKTR